MAQQRKKEIGVRKVLGASVSDIISLLSVSFMALVSLSFIISIPVIWVVMNKWLSSFEYRFSIGPSVFVATGLIILLITLITVCSQAIKAAVSNPVKALRSD